jgi:hypothetical protein
MHTNLYNRVKAANPFEQDYQKKKKLKERLEAKRSSQTAPKASEKKTKREVNADLAARLEYKAADTKQRQSGRRCFVGQPFRDLFTNPDFHIMKMTRLQAS